MKNIIAVITGADGETYCAEPLPRRVTAAPQLGPRSHVAAVAVLDRAGNDAVASANYLRFIAAPDDPPWFLITDLLLADAPTEPAYSETLPPIA